MEYDIEKDQPQTKPTGVKILAWLFALGGIGTVAASIYAYSNRAQVAPAVETIGVSPVFLVGSVAFLAALSIASGVGFLSGKKWGWWLGTFFFAYSIARNLNTAIVVSYLADAGVSDPSFRSPMFYMFKHGIRVLIHAAVYWYLLGNGVRAYFGVESVSRAKVIAIEVCICALLFVLGSAFGWNG